MASKWNKGYGDYAAQPIGLARTMDETPFSDGSNATLIENFHVDERGFLVSGSFVTQLVPPEWKDNFNTWVLDPLPPGMIGWIAPFPITQKTIGMGFMYRDGEAPEILLLTKVGVYRFAPWERFGTDNGLVEQFHYERPIDTAVDSLGTTSRVGPASAQKFPAQVETVANRMYFSFCDGGNVWVWDGYRVRPVGFASKPGPPDAMGPQRNTLLTGGENAGGWAHRGRVGNAESNWTEETGYGPRVHTVGGVDLGLWRYAVVFEGADGAYSAMSDLGGHVSMRKQVCQYTANSDNDANLAEETPDAFLKRFRVFNIPKGPDNCVARILLRTRNLRRLPPGDDGSLRFLHRIPNAVATEYVDDITDGELGAVWQDREPFPIGIHLLKNFNGSMFYLRSQAHPSRVWWSEQESFAGPIPESILFGHWMDVYPSTGPITAAHPTTLPGSNAPAMLVFKDNAAHFLGGAYPEWQMGTIHASAGCAGPSLVQTDPDGNTIWYGSNTFWRLSKDGIEDIGAPIRKRLQRVNTKAARMGVSWFDAVNREVVFWLPMDDSTTPNLGFVWDYTASGWRMLSTMTEVSCALSIPHEKLVIAKGVYNEVENTWVYGRGWDSPQVGNAVGVESTYISGWVTMSKFGPGMHAAKRAARLVVTGEDSSSANAFVSVFANHNGVDQATQQQDMVCCHPEQDVPFLASALYGEEYWRTPRLYTSQLAVDATNARTLQVKFTVTGRAVLFNIDVYGPQISGAFSRVPGGEG